MYFVTTFFPDDHIKSKTNITEPPLSMNLLPYSDVDSSLRALAGRAEGFGRSAIGGLRGALHYVTSLAGIIFVPSLGFWI